MNSAPIQRMSLAFLKAVIVFIGIGALAFLLWEPHVEGRNLHAKLFQIYFKDPFLAYVYIASIPFFVALYQAITLLTHIEKHTVFSQDSVRVVRTIQHCAGAIVAFALGAEAYIFLVQRGKDDIVGGVAMGLFVILASIVIAAAAAVLEKILQRGVDVKAGKNLKV